MLQDTAFTAYLAFDKDTSPPTNLTKKKLNREKNNEKMMLLKRLIEVTLK